VDKGEVTKKRVGWSQSKARQINDTDGRERPAFLPEKKASSMTVKGHWPLTGENPKRKLGEGNALRELRQNRLKLFYLQVKERTSPPMERRYGGSTGAPGEPPGENKRQWAKLRTDITKKKKKT